MTRTIFVLFGLLFVACARRSEPLPAGSALVNDAAQPVASEAPKFDELPPLAGEWLEPLADGGGDAAFVAVPIGTTAKRPLVVALHAALDHPRMACLEWRAMFGPEPFIVCPHGEKLGSVYAWGDPKKLRASIERAVAAAEYKFPKRIDRAGAVWASYSQSGMLAAHALASPGMGFRYAVFFEGVPHDDRALPKVLQGVGVRRALFVNQQGGWSYRHAAAAKSLGPRIEAKHVLIGDGSMGHFIRGETLERMHEELPWLIAGDADWSTAREVTP